MAFSTPPEKHRISPDGAQPPPTTLLSKVVTVVVALAVFFAGILVVAQIQVRRDKARENRETADRILQGISETPQLKEEFARTGGDPEDFRAFTAWRCQRPNMDNFEMRNCLRYRMSNP